jgi:hypothetical protein
VDKETSEKYIFSFTAVSAPIADFTRLAEMLVLANYDWTRLTRDVVSKEKERTNQRHFQEMRMRFGKLTNDEIDLLAFGDLNDKKLVALIAMCKAYRFIFDFVMEVIREKALVYDFELRESDYNSFINRKSYGHPEYEILSVVTKKKTKQVLFRILEQVGLIDSAKNRHIQQLLVSPGLCRIICNDSPALLKLLLKPDQEILELSNGN